MDWKRLRQHRNPWSSETEAPGTSRSTRARTPRSNTSVASAMPVSEESSAWQSIDTDQKQKFNLIKSREIDLANQLHAIRNRFGRPMKGTMQKESNILLELGKVYLEKLRDSKDREQKLNYIRCGTLLHAAIVRYKRLGNQPVKLSEAESLCCKLSQELLQSCGSKSTKNLFEISSSIHKKITIMRENVKSFITDHLDRPEETLGNKPPEWVQKIRNLPVDKLPSEAEIEKILSCGTNPVEQTITRNMKELNKKMTSDYKEIMHEIAKECLNLRDTKPCQTKFSVVGLGSLAREEATMYSDFEHVILLEEGVDSNENYQEILEYFRWFSVVFQTIVIGFGETIIPSVQVKSLNDDSSGDSSKSWFYDETTPNGIAFDGMLPHACKIPLGRSTTKNRPYAVELIKTPKDMATYLTHDECIKNGYHLDDVLKCTCLVYGDNETFAQFVQNCKNTDEGGVEYAKKYVEKIAHNFNPYVRNASTEMRANEAFDIKNVFYRPLATVLGFLARIHGIQFTSTFEAIDGLRQINAINKQLYHHSTYAFAVVCELRVKLYASVNQQRHQINLDRLQKIVGEDGFWACRVMILFLGNSNLIDRHMQAIHTNNMAILEKYNKEWTTPSVVKLALTLSNRGYCQESTILTEKIRQHSNVGCTNMHERYLLQSHYILQSHYTLLLKEPNQSYINEAENAYKRFLEYKDISDNQRLQAHYMMGGIYFLFQLRYLERSMSVFRKYFRICRNLPNQGYPAITFTVAFHAYHTLAVQKMDPAEAEEHLNTIFRGCKLDTEHKIIKRCSAIRIQLYQLEQLHPKQKYLLQELRSISEEIVRHCGKLQRPRLRLVEVVVLQICLLSFSDVINTIDLIEKMPKTHCNTYDLPDHHLELVRFICLCRLGRYTEALDGTKVEKLSQEEREKHLLQFLISKVWRQLHSPDFPSKYELIKILHEITKLKVHKQLHFLFDKERIPYMQFLQPYGKSMKELGFITYRCIRILLASLIPSHWNRSGHSFFLALAISRLCSRI